jgi:hypothetical protein
MKNLRGCLIYLRHYRNACVTTLLLSLLPIGGFAFVINSSITLEQDFVLFQEENTISRDTVPEPRKVMLQSVIIPGRGQITNQQIWKVPIIYGLLASVAGYMVFANQRYQGYKAAYYNSFEQNRDQRFGPTPAFIPEGQPAEIYRLNRNQFRNNRDLSGVVFVLVYGLNVADAYIFAQLRDFDVSDDLSAGFRIKHENIAGQMHPHLTLKINF